MSDTPTRVYSHGPLTVEWWADRCVHCEHCVTSLPAVFNLERRPWVDLSGADSSKILEACEACPSKALVGAIE